MEKLLEYVREGDAPHAVERITELLDGGAHNDVFNRWLARKQLDTDRWLPGMIDQYRGHDPKIALAAPIVALLDRWQERYALGLVSDGRLAGRDGQ